MPPPVKNLLNSACGSIILNTLEQDLLIKLHCEIIVEGQDLIDLF